MRARNKFGTSSIGPLAGKRVLKIIVLEVFFILAFMYFSESPNISNFKATRHDWNVYGNGIEIKYKSLCDENRDCTEYEFSLKRNSAKEPRPKMSVRNTDFIVKVPSNWTVSVDQ